MALVIREVREQELDAILALNNAAAPGILPVDSTRIRQLFDIAAYFRIAEIDGVIGGFLIALTPKAAARRMSSGRGKWSSKRSGEEGLGESPGDLPCSSWSQPSQTTKSVAGIDDVGGAECQ